MSCGCNDRATKTVCGCKIDGLHGTTTSMLDSETWEVWSDFPTIVTSDDDSVNIVKTVETTDDGRATTTTYDLSFECCDEKVKLCTNSPALFLNQILNFQSPLTSVIDCNTGTWDVGVDLTGVEHPEYKTCGGGTLTVNDEVALTDDLLNIKLTDQYARYDGPNPLEDNIIDPTDACEDRYIGPNCDPCIVGRKGVAKIRLNNDFIIEQPVNAGASSGGFYMLTDSTVSGAIQGVTLSNQDRNSVSPQRTSELAYGGLSTNITGAICNDCDYSRLVNARFRGSVEGSRGVNGLRVQLYTVSTAGDIKPVAEWRDSPISDPDVDGPTGPVDSYPDNYQITAAGSQNNRRNQGYKDQERQSFDASERFWLEPNTCLVAVLKVSSFNDDPQYNLTYPAQAGILGALASDGTVSGDLGAFIEVETIDDPCLVKEHQEECGCV